RWEAITTVAAGIGAVVYADPAGRFIIDDQPSLDSPAVWQVSVGSNLVKAKTSSSRSGVYHRIVVRDDNFSSDDESFSATAVVTNPTSPTWFEVASLGGYGKVMKIENIRTLSSQRAALSAARGILARTAGGASAVDLSSVPNHALERLDVLDIRTDANYVNSIRRHVVDGFEMDLAPVGAFDVKTRDLGSVVASWQ